MNKYRQTAADLDNGYEHPDAEMTGEMLAALVLATLIAVGVAALAVYWWCS